MHLAFLSAITLLLMLNLNAAGAQSPDSRQRAREAFELGQDAHDRGDLALAIRHYSDAIDADPSRFPPYYQRSIALIGLGRPAEAEMDLRKTLELNPGFARANRALGRLLLDRGEMLEAAGMLRQALDTDPDIEGVRVLLGSSLVKLNRLEESERILTEAIERGEEKGLAWALRGYTRERLGRAEDAIKDYSSALDLDPANPLALEGRARVRAASGDLRGAIQDYTESHRLQPSRVTALALARLHTESGQIEAAVRIYRSISTESPEDLEVRAEMARLLAELGHSAEARREAFVVVSARPDDARFLILAGDLNQFEDLEAAAGFYRRAVKLEPSNIRARVQLGSVLVRSMKYDEAISILADIINAEPENYTARANLATALFKLRRYPEAAREFIWIIGKKPDIAASYYFLAICFDQLGDCDQALRAYREFTKRADPESNRGEIEEANGRAGQLERLIKEGKCGKEQKRSRE